MEGIDAHHGINARCPDGVDVVQHVRDALLQKSQVFLGIGIGQGQTSHYLGSATMHLQCPDGAGKYRHVRLETTIATLDIPELFESDVRGEAALGNMIIKHLQPDTVGDDGGLAHSDVGKGTGMHHTGLVLRGAH